MFISVTTPIQVSATVKTVQLRLAALGFSPGMPDGKYGKGTASAVQAFQSAIGIKADGVVGPQTYTALAVFYLAKSAPSVIGVWALGMMWHESGFLPNAKAGDGRRGLLLAGADYPSVSLTTGARQSDAEAAAADGAIAQQWQKGLGYLASLLQLVAGLVKAPAASLGTAPGMRLAAFAHRSSPECLRQALARPDVGSAGYAWSAVLRAGVSGLDPACAAAFSQIVGTLYVTNVMATAAAYAGVLKQPAGAFTVPASTAAAAAPQNLVATAPPAAPDPGTAPAVVAPTPAAATAAAQPTVDVPAPASPAAAEAPRGSDEAQGTAPAPVQTSAPGAAAPLTVTIPPAMGAQVKPASSGGGGPLLAGAVIVGLLASGRGKRGKTGKGARKKPRR